MNQRIFLIVLVMSATPVMATGGAEPSEVERLKEQLREANEAFARALREHQMTIQSITHRLEALEPGPEAAGPAQATNGMAVNSVRVEQVPAKAWSPADPIRIGNAQAYMDLGLVGTFAVGGSTANDIAGGTEVGGHDPNQRGFTVQGVEATFTGAVDPYVRGLATLSFSVDAEGESFFELEEGWMETISLPGNLKLRGGQIYSQFGRHNPTHLHTWDFVDTPLINGLILGPDGLRNPGAFLSWLAPTPFYTELILGVQNSQGETAASFRGSAGHGHDTDEEELPYSYRHRDNDRGVATFSDLLLTPRLATSFELSETVTVLLGLSGAFGPNNIGGANGSDTRTEIYGADLTFKWKPVRHHGGFPFVKWQTEGMLRRSDVAAFDWDEDGDGVLSPGEIEDLGTGLPALLDGERLTDYGIYTQWVYGFRKGWMAGLRLDWFQGDTADYERRDLALDGELLGRDPLRDRRWRVSPNLTWYPTEFSKVRLQYNYDDRRDIGIDHSVWLQFEFILGAHAAHQF